MPGEVGSAVFAVRTDLSQFETGLSRARGEARQLGANFGTTASGIQGSAKNIGRSIVALGVVTGLKKVGKDALDAASDVESAVSRMEGLVGISTDVLKKWEDDFKRLGPALGKTPAELADAMFFVTSAGLRGARAMDALVESTKGAQGGLGDLNVVADAVTSALNAYPPEILNAAKATDILVATVREGKLEASQLAPVIGDVIPLAAEMGIEFEQVGGIIAALSRTGSDAPKAVTGLRAALRSLARPSQEASTELDKLFGVVKDGEVVMGSGATVIRDMIRTDGPLQGFIKIFEGLQAQGLVTGRDMRKLFADLDAVREAGGSEAEILDRINASIQSIGTGNKMGGFSETLGAIFNDSKGLLAVLDLIGPSLETNVKIMANMENTAGSTERAFAAVADDLDFAETAAQASLEGLFASLGKVATPVVTEFLQHITGFVSTLTEKFDSLDEGKQKAFVAAIAAIAGIAAVAGIAATLAAIANPIGAIVAGIALVGVGVGAVISNWEEITTFVRTKISELGTFLTDHPIGKLLTTIFPVLNIFKDFEEFVEDVKALFKDLIAFFKGEGNVGDVIKSLFNVLGPVILGPIVNVLNALQDVFAAGLNVLIDQINKIILNKQGDVRRVFQAIGVQPLEHLDPTEITVPALAEGAIVRGPTMALVGEAGPELILPLGADKKARRQDLLRQAGMHGFEDGGLVSPDGSFILTNAHVVWEMEKIFVSMGTKTMEAFLVAIDHVQDLALLQVNEKLAGIRLGEMIPEPGDHVYVLGSPAMVTEMVTQGRVLNKDSGFEYAGFGGSGQDSFQFSAPISGGSSGGPIIDFEGNLIGLSAWGGGGEWGGVELTGILSFLEHFASGKRDEQVALSWSDPTVSSVYDSVIHNPGLGYYAKTSDFYSFSQLQQWFFDNLFPGTPFKHLIGEGWDKVKPEGELKYDYHRLLLGAGGVFHNVEGPTLVGEEIDSLIDQFLLVREEAREFVNTLPTDVFVGPDGKLFRGEDTYFEIMGQDRSDIYEMLEDFVPFILRIRELYSELDKIRIQAGNVHTRASDLSAGSLSGETDIPLRDVESFLRGDFDSLLRSVPDVTVVSYTLFPWYDELKGSGVVLSRIPGLAAGGIVPGSPEGQFIIAGEGGQSEAIVPLDKWFESQEKTNKYLKEIVNSFQLLDMGPTSFSRLPEFVDPGTSKALTDYVLGSHDLNAYLNKFEDIWTETEQTGFDRQAKLLELLVSDIESISKVFRGGPLSSEGFLSTSVDPHIALLFSLVASDAGQPNAQQSIFNQLSMDNAQGIVTNYEQMEVIVPPGVQIQVDQSFVTKLTEMMDDDVQSILEELAESWDVSDYLQDAIAANPDIQVNIGRIIQGMVAETLGGGPIGGGFRGEPRGTEIYGMSGEEDAQKIIWGPLITPGGVVIRAFKQIWDEGQKILWGPDVVEPTIEALRDVPWDASEALDAYVSDSTELNKLLRQGVSRHSRLTYDDFGFEGTVSEYLSQMRSHVETFTDIDTLFRGISGQSIGQIISFLEKNKQFVSMSTNLGIAKEYAEPLPNEPVSAIVTIDNIDEVSGIRLAEDTMESEFILMNDTQFEILSSVKDMNTGIWDIGAKILQADVQGARAYKTGQLMGDPVIGMSIDELTAPVPIGGGFQADLRSPEAYGMAAPEDAQKIIWGPLITPGGLVIRAFKQIWDEGQKILWGPDVIEPTIEALKANFDFDALTEYVADSGPYNEDLKQGVISPETEYLRDQLLKLVESINNMTLFRGQQDPEWLDQFERTPEGNFRSKIFLSTSDDEDVAEAYNDFGLMVIKGVKSAIEAPGDQIIIPPGTEFKLDLSSNPVIADVIGGRAYKTGQLVDDSGELYTPSNPIYDFNASTDLDIGGMLTDFVGGTGKAGKAIQDFIQSGLDPMSLVMTALTEVFAGLFSVAGPVLEEVFAPIFNLLTLIGESLGKALVPVLKFLQPIILALANAFAVIYNVIVSIINVASLGFADIETIDLDELNNPTPAVAASDVGADRASGANYRQAQQISVTQNIYDNYVLGGSFQEFAIKLRDEFERIQHVRG